MTCEPSQGVVTDYNGEFGPELQTVVPYAYYLFQHHALRKTVSALDTKCFYYFSDNHEERYTQRRFMKARERTNRGIPNPSEHVSRLNTSQWTPPPYKARFRNERFVWSKDPVVISNKFTQEWGSDPVNYIDLPELAQIILLLKDRYQVIYCRALPGNITLDENFSHPFADFDLISRYPEVLTIEQLQSQNPDLSFNELQLGVYANCERFISVQGGNSVLASYFGGFNVIYALRGDELTCGDFNHFPLYAGTRIVPCWNTRDLLSLIETIYVSDGGLFARWKTRWTCLRQMQKYRMRVLLSKMHRGLQRRVLGRLFPQKEC